MARRNQFICTSEDDLKHVFIVPMHLSLSEMCQDGYRESTSAYERGSLLPLEMNACLPGASGMQPRDPCRPWRGTLASGHKPR